MKYRHLLSFLLFDYWFQLVTGTTEVLRPRGVPLSKKIFYDPRKEVFNCIDGSTTVPFIFVNDDYCDCPDGSDEPGTSACPDGVFHCSNVGHIGLDIPSSRVNDGICDCCDSSDEYNTSVGCVNNCIELGAKAREEARRRAELLREGSEIREQYKKESMKRRSELTNEIAEIRQQLGEAEEMKNQKEAMKKSAEDMEKAVLEKEKVEKEERNKVSIEEALRRAQEMDKKQAEETFQKLDVNGDGTLTYQEMKLVHLLDKNRNGEVEDEEAKFYLHMKEEMSLVEWVSDAWPIYKPIYVLQIRLSQKQLTTKSPKTDTTPPSFEPTNPPEAIDTEIPDIDTPDLSTPESLHEDEPVYPDDEEEEDEELEHEDHESLPKENEGDKDEIDTTDPHSPKDDIEPPHDPETQAIIDAAKKARDEFKDVETKFYDLKNKIKDLESTLETDFGPDAEFLILKNQCFELTNLEYTYKLCLFDKVTQSLKDGGMDTNLGRWGRWAGQEPNKYSIMKYEGGTTCWNGPARSVEVHLLCGLNNELLSASEPSRCEYRFDFQTPALCVSNHIHDEHIHTEL